MWCKRLRNCVARAEAPARGHAAGAPADRPTLLRTRAHAGTAAAACIWCSRRAVSGGCDGRGGGAAHRLVAGAEAASGAAAAAAAAAEAGHAALDRLEPAAAVGEGDGEVDHDGEEGAEHHEAEGVRRVVAEAVEGVARHAAGRRRLGGEHVGAGGGLGGAQHGEGGGGAPLVAQQLDRELALAGEAGGGVDGAVEGVRIAAGAGGKAHGEGAGVGAQR